MPIKIDIGSGGFKRPGFVGIDNVTAGGATDIVCDIEHDRWPLDDDSVDEMFSSHCFEHVDQFNIPHIFQELTRVCTHGAVLQIWNPYAFHRDAFVWSHRTYLTEELYYHLCLLHEPWARILGGRWFLQEVRYHIDPDVVASCKSFGMPVDFAINHLINVVKEFGVFIHIDKRNEYTRDPAAFARCTVDDVGTLLMRETRELNHQPLTVGPYKPLVIAPPTWLEAALKRKK